MPACVLLFAFLSAAVWYLASAKTTPSSVVWSALSTNSQAAPVVVTATWFAVLVDLNVAEYYGAGFYVDGLDTYVEVHSTNITNNKVICYGGAGGGGMYITNEAVVYGGMELWYAVCVCVCLSFFFYF